MATEPEPAYFADENCLGLGKLLRRSGRKDVLYPGHEDLPEVPLGALDLERMPLIGTRELIVLTRHRRIRSRPAELRTYVEYAMRSVWIGAKRDLGPRDRLGLFLRHEGRLQCEVIKRGPGSWALSLGSSGLRPLTVRDNV